MANGLRVKGENTSLVVVVDGAPQAGSFKKVEQLNWKPLQEIQDSNFLGESESDFDIQHDGFEVNFTIHEQENLAVESVLIPSVNALKAGDTLPSVTLVFIKSYRDPSLPVKTLTFQTVKLIMTGQDAGDRKGYIKSTFTGRCRHLDVA
jgi:hypothetical protein